MIVITEQKLDDLLDKLEKCVDTDDHDCHCHLYRSPAKRVLEEFFENL